MNTPDSFSMPARTYFPGMGDAVADRTINRRLPDGSIESWAQVAQRVATGNAMLHADSEHEFHAMNKHLRQASLLMSGRHLQHGDATQPTRNQEVFTNCSTSATSFLLFYLLLNGSGVGRSYDDSMIVVDWGNMPVVVPVIDYGHADVRSGEIKPNPLRDNEHLYAGKHVVYFKVEDSREGWAKAVEKMEVMTFRGMRDSVLLLDFNDVRPRGSPIAGMQNRPASGPGPLMEAISKIAKLRDAWMPPWRAAMYADHYLAECVLVGGARRAARMATKAWTDRGILDFIKVKQGGFLWSSNNSVMVDTDFWRHVQNGIAGVHSHDPFIDDEQTHAMNVYEAICKHSYFDQTGEPGIINADKLVENTEGYEAMIADPAPYVESERLKLSDDGHDLIRALIKKWQASKYKMITNPCGEITLSMIGGYCVIADVVPYHAGMIDKGGSSQKYMADWDDDAEDAFRTATRALMRVNTMDCLYKKEVRRTNRIGVGITGLHEYAWARFGYGWKDLVVEQKSKDFWMMLSRFKRSVSDEARTYAAKLGVAVPHTDTTMKPAGTTSKLFGLTEGAHLPSMREFVRWVQFRNDDPLIKQYEEKGYPVRKLVTYSGTTIVGFPTQPVICTLGMEDKLVTAAEATPEEQYEFLRLLEKYWIRGVDEQGNSLPWDSGNQVSYTLKYNPKTVGFEEFKKTLLAGQSTVRCCSVMPQTDTDNSAYEYLPEQPVSRQEFDAIVSRIKDTDGHSQDIGFEHMTCDGGACPIDFRESKV